MRGIRESCRLQWSKELLWSDLYQTRWVGQLLAELTNKIYHLLITVRTNNDMDIPLCLHRLAHRCTHRRVSDDLLHQQCLTRKLIPRVVIKRLGPRCEITALDIHQWQITLFNKREQICRNIANIIGLSVLPFDRNQDITSLIINCINKRIYRGAFFTTQVMLLAQKSLVIQHKLKSDIRWLFLAIRCLCMINRRRQDFHDRWA